MWTKRHHLRQPGLVPMARHYSPILMQGKSPQGGKNKIFGFTVTVEPLDTVPYFTTRKHGDFDGLISGGAHFALSHTSSRRRFIQWLGIGS
jgi:hypothetical protein